MASATLLENRLFEQNYFSAKLAGSLPEVSGLDDALKLCQGLFKDNPGLDSYQEKQLEDKIIKPILEALGWFIWPKDVKIISGSREEIDYALFADPHKFAAYKKLTRERRYANFTGISVLVESKKASQPLDTRKAAREDNPYFQLLNYLQTSRVNHGFLTNGRQWWFLDNSLAAAEKRYLAFYLDAILAENAAREFSLFWRFFNVKNFTPAEGKAPPPVSRAAEEDLRQRVRVEDDIKTLIYGDDGRDSIFEDIGRAIFEATGSDAGPDNLRQIFENSLYLIFRLIFIAYFESRHRRLLESHENYPAVALWRIYADLRKKRGMKYTGWYHLKRLFHILDKGEPALSVPLLNGGLFNPGKAPLLNDPGVIGDQALYGVLERLLCDADGNQRDFSALSVVHLGTIYEGLLEFEFRVAEEALKYIYAHTRDGGLEGYFDAYDLADLKIKTPKGKPGPKVLRSLDRGAFYLVSAKNNRKVGGNFYTPEALARPLAERAVEQQLGGSFKAGRSILEMRVLDNACGSGHLLIEVLNVLTLKAQSRLASDAALVRTLAAERARIEDNLRNLGLEPDKAGLDEFALLKRILLKKVVYGVDSSPFAVELAQLALWIETFIFGTPLSFVEHHLKCGNSLIGASLETAENRLAEANPLFSRSIRASLRELKAELAGLSVLNDATQADVEASKQKYHDEIGPRLERLNWYLDVVNHLAVSSLDPGRRRQPPPLEHLAMEKREAAAPGYPELVDEMRARYGFFNWEVEFPEAFVEAEEGKAGFNLIIGNPPWDKTKFEEPLFFAQYRSNYRSLGNSAKKKLAADLLAKPHIKAKYERERKYARLTNEYFKIHYPLNQGSGDGNLFRFFVERNLRLLAKGGSLNYVLPTGLLTEDGSTVLRRHILENFKVNYFDGFENREKVFPGVDSRYKFGLIQIENRKDPKQRAKTRFMLTDPAVLAGDAGVFDYGLDDLKSISPDHWAYMEAAGGRKDLDLLKRMYDLFRPLDPAWLDFRNELHATNDKGIFREKRAKGDLPLYKGAGIWQYHAAYAKPEYWLDPREFDAHLRDSEINRLIADVRPTIKTANPNQANAQTVLDALGLKTREDLGRFIRPDRNYIRLGFRMISSNTNERTLVASLLPRHVGAQNSLYLSIPKKYVLSRDFKSIECHETSLAKLLFAQAMLNALPVDWLI
ncbi:MAG: N-6 DNA methylase, partial [Planctomycetota bacterium]|nr:N-6 DNA methylase [Planctomycetota bacterium]